MGGRVHEEMTDVVGGGRGVDEEMTDVVGGGGEGDDVVEGWGWWGGRGVRAWLWRRACLGGVHAWVGGC